MTTTKKLTGMRLNSELLAELKAEAKTENRSLTNYVETLLRNRPRRKEDDEKHAGAKPVLFSEHRTF